MVRICSSFSGPFIKSHAKAEIFADHSGGLMTLIEGEPSGVVGDNCTLPARMELVMPDPSGILPDACLVVFRNYFGGKPL
jgi:hypothetical protein